MPQLPWSEIDTVLLDMDGTLLDLRFDNYFWAEFLPERYAERHGLTPERASAVLRSKLLAKQGTLEWYCTDFWTRELSLDIAAMKRETREHVRFLPGAEAFLRALRPRTFDRVLELVAKGLRLFEPAECANYLRNCGYRLAAPMSKTL